MSLNILLNFNQRCFMKKKVGIINSNKNFFMIEKDIEEL